MAALLKICLLRIFIKEVILILQNQIPMSLKTKLTPNAVLYISLGFKQHYCLQIFTLRKGENGHLQMVLYDGLVYIGATFEYPSVKTRPDTPQNDQILQEDQLSNSTTDKLAKRFPKPLDVVRVYPLLLAPNQPILIQQMEIVDSSVTQLLGREIIPLDQFMRRKKCPINMEQHDEQRIEGISSKKIKVNEEERINIDFTQKNQSFRGNLKQTQNQVIIQPIIILDKEDKDEDEQIFQIMQKERKKTSSRQMQIPMEIEQSRTQMIINPRQSNIISLVEEDNTEVNNKPKTSLRSTVSFKLSNQIDSSQPVLKHKDYSIPIADLYDRMQRFKIICRINFICRFISVNKKPGTKMMLIDEHGDQIFCLLMDKAAEKQVKGQLKLLRGKTYTFENGDVNRDDFGNLSIFMPWSGIVEIKKFIWGFHPKKMNKLGQIESIGSQTINIEKEQNSNKSHKQVNVCGIYKGFKYEPVLTNNQFKITGILCDPEQEKQIFFNLFVDELTPLPKAGSIISLHNMKVNNNGQTIRLDHTKRSYIVDQSENSHQYFTTLNQIHKKESWKLIDYRNLSEVAFVSRNIQQLRTLLSRMDDHDQCHSEIDCNISRISQKKSYNACMVCKKQTKPQPGLHTYCHNCKKINKCGKRIIFIAEVSDSTSSLELTFTSDQLEGFASMPGSEYINLEKQDRRSYLQLCSYQNIILKLRSERVIGGVNHWGISAHKPNHRHALEQIKQQTIDNKMKFVSNW